MTLNNREPDDELLREFEVGDVVEISEGPFAHVRAYVNTVDTRRGVAGLLFQLFCRQSEPYEVQMDQLQLICKGRHRPT
jgi:transcription antitermination factor NusG